MDPRSGDFVCLTRAQKEPIKVSLPYIKEWAIVVPKRLHVSLLHIPSEDPAGRYLMCKLVHIRGKLFLDTEGVRTGAIDSNANSDQLVGLCVR